MSSISAPYKGLATLTYIGTLNDSLKDCVRVSSLVVAKPSDGGSPRFIEFGWGIGWVPRVNDSDPNMQYHDHAQKFSCFRTVVSGSVGCLHDLGGITGGGNATFWITNENGDTTWTNRLYASKEQIGPAIETTFHYGRLIVQGERDNGSDSAYSHFDDLQRLKQYESTWGSWSTAYLDCDADPGYDLNIISSTEVKVQTGSGGTSC